MLYKEESVQISVSCLVCVPVIISEPEERRMDPAVFVTVGVQSTAFS
jgi:hypothetical protein